MPFVEDLDEFSPEDGPGVIGAVYTAVGAAAKTITGNFYDEYVEPLGGFEGSGPAFECPLVKMSSVAHGDALKVGADEYLIVGVKPDGQGMVLVRLQLQ